MRQQEHLPSNRQTADSHDFLPDFCSLRAVFWVVLFCGLITLVMTLLSVPWRGLDVLFLARCGFFLLWCGLLSAAVLCRFRRRLNQRPVAQTAALSLIIVLLVVAFVSVAAQWLMQGAFTGSGMWQLSAVNSFSQLGVAVVVVGMGLRVAYLEYRLRQRERHALASRLQALTARIHPHFLFNSLNTIAALVHDQPDVAEKASEDLAALLRASLNDSGEHWSWAEEKALCERYLSIESARLGQRLNWRWQDQSMAAHMAIPRLSVQPLVENAVLHGIQRCPEGGTVFVDASGDQSEVVIEVVSPLAPEAEQTESLGLSLALDNIRQRLQGLYGESAGLECGPEGMEFRARLHWRRPVAGDHLTS